jgi:Raf kinase inhibitor-like YbhB/YbcL family protein
MKLGSDSFRNRSAIPAAHAFKAGGSRNPHLQWSDAPAGTESLVLLCMRSDTPDGDCFHWGVVDIPASMLSIAAGALAAEAQVLLDGVPLRQSLNDYRSYGYHGPLRVPDETHHYIFRIYALDVQRLELPPQFTGADVLNAIYGHIIDEAQLIGAYT